MHRAFEPESDIANATHPEIRLFTVPKLKAVDPVPDVEGAWQRCEPSQVRNFSAVAYYFGRELQSALNVPVGLIHTSWGGSPAEVWMRWNVLATHPDYLATMIEPWPAREKQYRENLAAWESETEALKQQGQTQKRPRPQLGWRPAELYNGMIAPLVPYAIKDKNGIALKQIKGKPAALQPRFYGNDVPAAKLRPIHCFQIGEALAQFHIAGNDFYLKRQAHRGVFWWRRESEAIANRLSPDDAQLLKQEVLAFDELREAELDMPSGVIHGDLFHDNALFQDDKLVAILDMYNAATAYQLYDLAIVANDWCNNADYTIDIEREQALLEGYAQIRPFTADEATAWPILTRTAAMRFWLSRLIPWLGIAQASRQGGEMKLKDPDQYKQILLQRLQHSAKLL